MYARPNMITTTSRCCIAFQYCNPVGSSWYRLVFFSLALHTRLGAIHSLRIHIRKYVDSWWILNLCESVLIARVEHFAPLLTPLGVPSSSKVHFSIHGQQHLLEKARARRGYYTREYRPSSPFHGTLRRCDSPQSLSVAAR